MLRSYFIYCKMDNSSSPSTCRITNMDDEPMSLNLEVYDESSDEGSSEALEIVTSENELGECSGREHKRKRRDNSVDEMPEVLNNMEEEIERQLDAKAAKSNLTVANVKNILKHVITNEHVLAMVRRTIKDEVDDENEDEFPYEPKLTRAKAKELLRSQPDIWPITPLKKQSTSKCQVLIDQELSEDSSDEEYQPNEEEQSDEEKENESIASDVDTQPPTPNPPVCRSSNDCGTQTSWTEDGLFKIPKENIGQRTRSKLSLSDTPLETIEKAFVPPDITTDMYDSECDDEDWKDFLKNFTEPLTVDVNDTFDDDEADPEYNVLADEEEQTVDKEELRVDRAVKVSRKELNLLVAELFEYADMMSSDDEDPRTQPEVHTSQPEHPLPLKDSHNCEDQVKLISPPPPLPPEEVPVMEEVLHLSLEQRLLLEQQMRKHVQLTTQHFLQTFAHPVLWYMAGDFKSILVSLKYLAGGNSRSVFCSANLPESLKLVDIWERKLSTMSPEAIEIKSFVQKELNMANEISRTWRQAYQCKFPPQMMELVSQSDVFLYPLLLPSQPFRCVRFARPLHVPSEDSLIAIGLEQFEAYAKANPSTTKVNIFPRKSTSRRGKPSIANKGSLTEALPLIHAYLVPTRDPRQLYFHIRKAKVINGNPIQYYYEHNKAPAAEHYVIPLIPDMVKPPSKQPKELLPGIWRNYLYLEKLKPEAVSTFLLLRS